MSLYRVLRHLFRDTVYIRPRVGVDRNGKPIYGDPVKFSPAQVRRRPRRFRGVRGEDIVEAGSIIVGPEPAVPPTGLVILPDGTEIECAATGDHRTHAGYQLVGFGGYTAGGNITT